MGKILFSTHPKAGSQWVTDVLSDHRVLESVPHVRFKRHTGVFDWAVYLNEVDNTFIAPVYGVEHFLWQTFRGPDDKAIHIGRDPRDTALSWVYSTAFSHLTEAANTLVRAPLLTLGQRHRIMLGIDRFLHRNAVKLRGWVKAGSSPFCHLTTYERLVENEEQEFKAIFDFLGWPISPEVIRDVVATHTFEARSGGRKRGEIDRFSHYRQGMAGDWQNHFDRDLARQFEEAYPHLLVDLGYEKSDSWWESVPLTSPELLTQDGDARVSEISEAMAGALRERDRRWLREEAATLKRFALLENEVESLRAICAERLAVIENNDRHANDLLRICDERLTVIEQQTRAIEQLRAALGANAGA